MKGKRKILEQIILFITIFIIIMIVMPIDLDEIWSYGFAINISKGLIPYRDFNMVVTPIYPFSIALFLFIFGKNIIVFHLTQALFITIMSYFLFDLIGRKSWLVILFFFFPAPIFFPGYNILLFLFLVLLIWLEKNKKNDILIGFVIAITFLIKQSIGFFFLIPSIVFYYKDLKKIGCRLIGFIIPNMVFLLYLIITNSFKQFLDLCFLGLLDFASTNGKMFTLYFFLIVILILVTIIFIYKNKKDITLWYILVFYSIVIPLFDLKHFQEALLAFVFMLFYYEKITLKPEYSYYLLFMSIIVPQSIIIINYRIISKIEYPNHINNFEYRLIDKDTIELTEDVNDYLNKNSKEKFIFLDSNGYYFKIINDCNLENVDLINTGNWGYNGTEKLIRELERRKDYIFLINKAELNRGNQTDKKAMKYVLNKGKKIDSIRFYDVYILE